LVGGDPQGDIGLNLGTIQRDQHDHGKAFRAAALDGVAPKPVVGVRQFENGGRIDLVSGGRYLEELAAVLVQRQHSHRDEEDTLAASLRALANSGDYHFVIVDCPPGGHALQESVLRASRWLLIPAKTDDSSLRGLEDMAARFGAARRTNPTLTLLGVFVFDVGATSRRIISDAKKDLRRVLSSLPPETVLEAVIPHLEAPARLERSRGLCAAELEQSAEQQKPWHEVLKEGGDMSALTPKSSGHLAGAYFALTAEILNRIAVLSTANADRSAVVSS
jgi:chromosome partitioning protein